MKRTLKIAAAAAALGVGAMAFGTAARAGEDRAFTGTAEGEIVGFVPPATLVVEVSGRMSHLGNFTRSETINIAPDGTISGSLTFFASDGAELRASIDAHFVGDEDHVEGTYTFDGGTKRFTDATGTATFAAEKSGTHVTVSFDGTVNY
jgi:hypothetical protein